MTPPLDTILGHLEALVGVDTRNPPRNIDREGDLVKILRAALPDFDVAIEDLGEGCLIIDAKRGSAQTAFNVHLDTVPFADGWSSDPHTLRLADDRAYGLGTCDTKGAAAVLLAMASNYDGPLRFVFTTDEEAGKSRCVRHFVQADESLQSLAVMVVAEPTDATVRLEHRGICSVSGTFSGESAHASEAERPSAVHRAARFITAALDHHAASRNRLNFGRIEGGVKANMVAAHAELLFGFRNVPGSKYTDLLDDLRTLDESAQFEERFIGPSFPCDEAGPSAKAVSWARDVALSCDLPLGDPVDFWTEASLFAEAGIPTLVLGAGSIAQAHNIDEFVQFSQLEKLYELYLRVAQYHA